MTVLSVSFVCLLKCSAKKLDCVVDLYKIAGASRLISQSVQLSLQHWIVSSCAARCVPWENLGVNIQVRRAAKHFWPKIRFVSKQTDLSCHFLDRTKIWLVHSWRNEALIIVRLLVTTFLLGVIYEEIKACQKWRQSSQRSLRLPVTWYLRIGDWTVSSICMKLRVELLDKELSNKHEFCESRALHLRA
jgi:hypothetical protein